MAKLYFDIGANYQEVERLTKEIENLQDKLRRVNSNTDPLKVKEWTKDLQTAKLRLAEFVSSAAMSGAKIEEFAKNVSFKDLNDSFKELANNFKSNPAIQLVSQFDRYDEKVKALDKVIKRSSELIEHYKKRLGKLQKKSREALTSGDSAAYEKYGKEITSQLEVIDKLTKKKDEHQRVLNLVTGATDEESDSIKKNTGLMESLLGGTEKYKEIMALLPGPIKEVVSGINGVTQASLKFLATPLGAVVAALALAFASLKTYLTKTEEGQMRLAKISGTLKGAMMTLEDAAAKVGKAIFDAFNSPLDSVKKIGSAIKQDVIDRLETIKESAVAFGEFFSKILNGVKFTDAFAEFKEALANTPDGKKIQGVANGLGTAADNAARIAAAMADIEKKRLNLDLRESRWQIEKSRLSAEKAELGDTYRDPTTSPEARQAAYEKYLSIIQKEREMEVGFANERIALKKQELALTDTNSIEDQKELNSLITDRNQIEAGYISELASTSRMRATIYRAAKNDEKELFNLIMSNREAENALLEESHQKRLEQIQIEHERELQSIKELKENWEKEQDGQLTPEQQDILKDKTRLNEQKRAKSVEELGEAVYDRYKSLEDQRFDLEKEYTSDYEDLWDAFLHTGDEKFLRSIEMRTKAYQKSLRDMEKDTAAAMKLIFYDIDLMSKTTLDTAIEKAKEQLAALLEAPDANASDISSMRSQLDNLISARMNYDFTGWGGSITDVLRINGRKQSLQARNQIDRAKLATLKEGTKEYENLRQSIDLSDQGIRKLEDDQKKAIASVVSGEVVETIQKIGSGLHEIARISGDGEIELLADQFDQLGGVLSSVVSGLSQGGFLGGVLGGMGSLITIMIESIFDAKAAEVEAKVAANEYTHSLKLLGLQAKDTANIFGNNDFGFSTDAYEKAQKAKKEYEELYEWIKNQFFNRTKNPETNDMLVQGYREVGIITDDDELNLDVLGAYLEKNGGDKEFDKLMELKSAYEQLRDAVSDYVGALTGQTATDIAKGMVDNFARTGSAILDMSDNLNTFKRNLAESRVEALLMEKVFTKERQDEVTALLASGNVNGAIEAYNKLLEEANGMSTEIEAFLAGVNIQEINDQKATAGGFQTMSQDTGTELNGRFTALQISGENIDEGIRSIVENFSLFAERFASQFIAIDDIRNIQAQSLIELQGINENTLLALKPIREMNDTLGQIKMKVDKL